MRLSGVMLFSLFLGFTPAVAHAAGSDPVPSEPDELRMARDAVKADDFAKAESLLRKVVADDPKSADAWNLLGYSTRKQEKIKEAEEYYGKALAIDSKHVGTLEYLGILYVNTGRIDEARKLLARIDDVCFFSCSEYDDLKKAIETGKSAW